MRVHYEWRILIDAVGDVFVPYEEWNLVCGNIDLIVGGYIVEVNIDVTPSEVDVNRVGAPLEVNLLRTEWLF